MKTKQQKGKVGQNFDDFLRQEGRLAESNHQAIKRVIAYQLAVAMDEQHLTKTAFARKINTSRSQLDRLLDPDNARVTLDALARAATALGHELHIDLK